jgi:hypothetical protein
MIRARKEYNNNNNNNKIGRNDPWLICKVLCSNNNNNNVVVVVVVTIIKIALRFGFIMSIAGIFLDSFGNIPSGRGNAEVSSIRFDRSAFGQRRI